MTHVSTCAYEALLLYYTGMNFNRAISAGQNSHSWLSLGLRLFCVLSLCLAYLFANSESGGYRQKRISSGAISADNTSETTGGYCCGNQEFEIDAILTSDRENNPFLFLVSLRAGFETCSFLRIESALSEMSDCGAATTPPDFALSYLFTLTQFSHFLC